MIWSKLNRIIQKGKVCSKWVMNLQIQNLLICKKDNIKWFADGSWRSAIFFTGVLGWCLSDSMANFQGSNLDFRIWKFGANTFFQHRTYLLWYCTNCCLAKTKIIFRIAKSDYFPLVETKSQGLRNGRWVTSIHRVSNASCDLLHLEARRIFSR